MKLFWHYEGINSGVFLLFEIFPLYETPAVSLSFSVQRFTVISLGKCCIWLVSADFYCVLFIGRSFCYFWSKKCFMSTFHCVRRRVNHTA